jgi:PIN domain nuclease of toxin-antitoxin system
LNGYLLDTHIWLWALLSDEKLSPEIRAALEVPDRLWISPVSVVEAHVAIERGRVAAESPAGVWIREALAAVPLLEAPMTIDIALRSRELATRHADPADRFLVATAAVLGLTLVTADRRLARTKDCEILLNRLRRN